MIPYNKWRHDLQAAVLTIDNAIGLLERGDDVDPELIAATIASMRKVRANLDQQYLDLYSFQRQSKKLDE